MIKNRKAAILLVMISAIFWGISGTSTQNLFQQYQFDVNWLVTVRLLISGILMLLLQYLLKDRQQIIAVWQSKRTAFQLLVFSIFGMLLVQYTYMAAIGHGNAAIATLLQYLAPVMIIGYLVISKQAVLSGQDLITVTLALLGSFLLLTNGSFTQLSVPGIAIFWGILSGAALAFYTLYAISLLAHFDSLVIVGWAMIIGSIFLSFIYPPWEVALPTFSLGASANLFFVIIFGTMIPYWIYVESLHILSAKETSLVGSLEPLAAVVATVVWLQEPFGAFQWLGTFCIIGMILFIAFMKKEAK